MIGKYAERTAVRLAIFSLIATALVWAVLPTAGALNEFRDAQVITLHERAAVDAVLRFGQLPLWDPWYCGGLHALGEPQSRAFAPPFLLSLIFGPERAEPLVVFLFTVLGMEGTYRWLRLRVEDAAAALQVAPLFALSGHFAVAYYCGWTNFFGFDLLPFVLLGVTLAARGRAAGIAVGAVAFAVMLAFGGAFAAPLVAVAAAVEALRAILEQPPSRRAHAVTMILALASFILAVSAVRLLPLAETLAAQPRIMAGTPGHLPKTLLAFLVRSLEAKGGVAAEPGSFFVGWGLLVLVLLGGANRRSLGAFLTVAVFLWLAAGYARQPALFALLRELPVFSALRYPERFLWIAILFACEPAAYALTRIPRLGGGRWRVASKVAFTVTVILTVGAQITMFHRVAGRRALGVVAVDRMSEFRQARGNRWLAAHYDGIGAGSLSCWETHPVTMSSKLRGDLAAEEYLADPSVGVARRVSWSPNAIVVDVSMASAGRLLVNQNWHPGWRASAGTVVSDEGLLAVDLPAGERELVLSFRPMSAIAGGATTLVALVALVVLVVDARRGRAPFVRGAAARSLALVLAPWMTLGAFVVTWSEPRFPPPAQQNADGTPALVAEVPADATRIGARFDLPIAVDAAKLDGPDHLANVAVDLYLRRTARIARTTGMFVHVQRRAGQAPIDEAGKKGAEPVDFFNADHQVAGRSFYLSDAPEGAIVRDAFGVHLKNAASGVYDVWVAFGHVSGRRGRANVLDPGTAAVDDRRIRVGTFTVP